MKQKEAGGREENRCMTELRASSTQKGGAREAEDERRWLSTATNVASVHPSSRLAARLEPPPGPPAPIKVTFNTACQHRPQGSLLEQRDRGERERWERYRPEQKPAL